MLETNAMISTVRASSYLLQLCKHFGHKVEVQYGPELGLIKFPFGQCALKADQDGLDLTVSADNQADLTKSCRVIASHLERFAFRENPKIEWRAVPVSASALT